MIAYQAARNALDTQMIRRNVGNVIHADCMIQGMAAAVLGAFEFEADGTVRSE